MPTKMQAAVVEQFGKPLVLQEWDVPTPGPGKILVKTEACGVCHTDDPAAILKAHIGGGAHGVLITAPSLPAFKQGVEMTRKTGACVLVGLPPGESPTLLFDVVANCITIRGSFVGTREDMAEAPAFAAAGQVKADIELQPLSDINAIFERREHGDVLSRVVLDFTHATKESAAFKTKGAVREAVPA